MTLRFGTDGVRGPATELTDELVRALGTAAARVLGSGSASTFLIGRDTRESGGRLEAALAAGLGDGGVAVATLGVVPTPAVAWTAAHLGALGAVISASHNSWPDNGIKFFAAGGRKLTESVESALEAELDAILAAARTDASSVADDASDRPGGPVSPAEGGADGWLDSVVGSLDGRRLDGLRVVIDCANGAASRVAPEALRALGAEVDVLHAEPDGRNINDGCGSTHPDDLRRRVVETGAAVGLAFDGDADRVLAVDETGALVDGDHLIALFAVDRRDRGLLHDDLVVVTVMTNLGFRLAMAEQTIEVVETPVGDRHVLEALQRTGGSLGGEQSGHIVFADMATTGDGLLSGVQLLDLVVRSGQPLSALAAAAMTRLPQVLVNVPVAVRRPDVAEIVGEQIAHEQALLGSTGRILIRPSGTEALVRVMVEAGDEALAREVANRLASVVAEACVPEPRPTGAVG